jgi:hypothetical protein
MAPALSARGVRLLNDRLNKLISAFKKFLKNAESLNEMLSDYKHTHFYAVAEPVDSQQWTISAIITLRHLSTLLCKER